MKGCVLNHIAGESHGKAGPRVETTCSPKAVAFSLIVQALEAVTEPPSPLIY